jgi:hypothetical protein
MIQFTIPGAPVAKGRGFKKASDQQILEAYALHGSCAKAGRALGMGAQSVHERLVRLGAIKHINVFSKSDEARLKQDYSKHAESGTLAALALDLGRTRHFICRKAKEMGLTDMKRPKPYISEKISELTKERIAKNGHPRGMAGKKHSAETLSVISNKSKARWDAMSADERLAATMQQLKAKEAKSGLVTTRPNATWKAGWRVVGGQRVYFRSRWEANYARYLEWLRLKGQIKAWEHEPETFWFEKVKRGCRSYLPDFKVTENNDSAVYHEVKGWMDDRSKTKIKRMRIYHPSIKLLVIDAKAYRSIAKTMRSLIPEWEADRSQAVVMVKELDGEPA